MSQSSRRRQVRRLLAGSLRGKRRTLLELMTWSLVEAIPTYLSGRLVARAIDHGFLAHRVATGLAWLAVLGASSAVGAWGTRQTFKRLAAVVEPFRDELVGLAVRGALHRSTAPGASPDTAGVAQVTLHVEIVREAYASVLMVVQSFVITTASALLGLFSLAPAALVLVVPPLVIGIILFAVVLARMAASQRDSILAGERIAGAVTSVALGMRDVVASGGEDTACAMVGEPIDAAAKATSSLARLTALRTVAVAIGSWLPVIFVLLRGRWLVQHGATTGVILGTLTYLLQGVQPALQTLARQLGGAGLWLLVTLDRVAETTEAAQPCGDVQRATHKINRAADRGYGLVVDDVTFRYGQRADPVISKLALEIPEGDHLAVVGPSGIGKSTLAGLITGLLEPQTGEVRIGNEVLENIDPASLSRLRVLIPQEAYVFPGSVADNLTYLNPGAPQEQVDEAIRKMGMRPLVRRLGGYQADIKVSSLSAGERQMITLARSYLSSAHIVVLDEATCHLDAAAEADVEQAFADRPGTLVVVAHRISSALRARRILVLDGAETELGTHQELLSRSGLYRDLVGRWQQEPERPHTEVVVNTNGARQSS